jgi:S1-C subfamily serine protease
MSESIDQFVWMCPTCNRRVPRRVAECRCGYKQTAAPELDSSEMGQSARPRRGYGLILLVAGIALGAAIPMFPIGAPPSPASFSPGAINGPKAAATLRATVPNTASSPRGSSVAPLTTVLPLPALAPAGPVALVSLEDVVSRVLPAVVSIQSGRARGTGFYIRPDYVLTNAHVVEGQTSVQLFAGATQRTARVLGTSPGADLAVLQVYNHDAHQPTLTLGTINGVRVGEEVIAVGSALGMLSNTVTRGIVSAVRKTGDVTLIQTDAAINPGNSGGPLVDRAGLVIGVNSLSIAKWAAESLSFAVAIDHASQLLNGQASLAAQTPLTGLSNMLRGGSSTGDDMRNQGEEAYEKIVVWAARGADQVDDYWQRNARNCVTNSPNLGDRKWFAALVPNAVHLNGQVYGCDDWLDNVTTGARRIEEEMRKAGEAARHNGVYPGVMRDIRRRYRIEWDGWDR